MKANLPFLQQLLLVLRVAVELKALQQRDGHLPGAAASPDLGPFSGQNNRLKGQHDKVKLSVLYSKP